MASTRKHKMYVDLADKEQCRTASPAPASPAVANLPPTVSSVVPTDDSVLLIIDVQHDFLPGGSLAVPEGDKVIPIIKQLRSKFARVVLSQDWHPENHSSFASNNPHTMTFEVIKLNGIDQVMWPDHCVQGTDGACIHPDIINDGDVIVQKGTDVEHDSYSAFFDNGKKNQTALADILTDNRVRRVFCVGLATDYCVAATANDAFDLGFHVSVIEDACRGIDSRRTATALEDLRKKSVQVIKSEDILG